MTENNNPGSERRKHKRFKKYFTLTYFDLANPSQLYEATQLKNISLGGMCMVTPRSFPPGTRLVVKMRTPFLLEFTNIEATVLESHPRVKDIIHETRLSFDNLTDSGKHLLTKLIEYFEKNEPKNGKN